MITATSGCTMPVTAIQASGAATAPARLISTARLTPRRRTRAAVTAETA